MIEKLQKLKPDEVLVLTGIVKGFSKEDILTKYQTTDKVYKKIHALYVKASVSDIDDTINHLTKKTSLEKAASILDVEVMDEVHGLARLDANMQTTADNINKKLNALVEDANGPIELLTVVQAFSLLRKAMFDKGVVINSQTNINNAKILGNRI